jgi:tetratricopeptide (TPR) repeat protein
MKRLGLFFGLAMTVALASFAVSGAVAGEAPPSVDYDFYMTRGVAAYNAQSYDRADADFQTALSARPEDPRATYLLGLSEVKEGKYAEAEQTLFRALELNTQKQDIYLALGEVSLKQEAYASAVEILEKIGGTKSPLAAYYLGLAYNGVGAYDRAVAPLSEALERAERENLDWAEGARYHLGISQYRVGQLAEAKKSFAGVRGNVPGSHRAEQSEQFLRQIEDGVALATENRRVSAWGVDLGIGLQYDDNVILDPSALTPVSSGGRKKDTRFVLQVDADYKRHPTSAWGAGYTFYQTLHSHAKLKDYNVQTHEPSLFLLYDQDRLKTRLDYAFTYTEVGESPYVKSHRLTPSLTLLHWPALSTRLFYRLDHHLYNKTAAFPENEERTGTNHAFGATVYRYADQGRRALWVGYVVDIEQADAEEWSGTGHQVLGGAEMLFDGGTRAYLSGDYTRRLYEHPSTFVNPPVERDDNIYTLSGRLSQPFMERMTVSLQYTYSRNESNLPIFDYTRGISSILLSGRF